MPDAEASYRHTGVLGSVAMATMTVREKRALTEHLLRLADAIRDVPPGDSHTALAGRFFQMIVLLQGAELISKDTWWNLKPRPSRHTSRGPRLPGQGAGVILRNHGKSR